MVTPKAGRAYHAIVRQLERLDDTERADVWQRLSTAYAPNRTNAAGVPLSTHVVAITGERMVGINELTDMVAEGLNRADRQRGVER